MERKFASKHDLIRAFAGSMNLISPEVENHHEKVSFLAYRLADIFSALAEDRPYRKGMEKEKVIMILREDAQNGLLSDRLVTLLTDHYDHIDSIRNIESKAASKVYQESLRAGNKRTDG